MANEMDQIGLPEVNEVEGLKRAIRNDEIIMDGLSGNYSNADRKILADRVEKNRDQLRVLGIDVEEN